MLQLGRPSPAWCGHGRGERSSPYWFNVTRAAELHYQISADQDTILVPPDPLLCLMSLYAQSSDSEGGASVGWAPQDPSILTYIFPIIPLSVQYRVSALSSAMQGASGVVLLVLTLQKPNPNSPISYWWKCRFWFQRSGVRSVSLHFYQVFRWHQCCWWEVHAGPTRLCKRCLPEVQRHTRMAGCVITPKDVQVLIPGALWICNITWQREAQVADGVKVDNLLTLK